MAFSFMSSITVKNFIKIVRSVTEISDRDGYTFWARLHCSEELEFFYGTKVKIIILMDKRSLRCRGILCSICPIELRSEHWSEGAGFPAA